MTVIQQNSGTFNGSGAFSVTLPSASSSSNRVVLLIAGNTTITTPSGYTLRTSQVNWMGHYLYDAAGGASSWSVTPGVAGQGMWYVAEVNGAYVSASGQNNTADATTYNTPTLTPTAGDRTLFASIGSLDTEAVVRTYSGWTNSFVEQADTGVAASDYPAGAVATLEVAANGSTGYSTTVTISSGGTGRSALIGAYVSVTGGGGTTLSPSSIASTEAFGTAVITKNLTSSPSSITTAEAFGTVVVALSLLASPTGIPSAQAFGTPSVTIPIQASPTGIASSGTFGTVSVSGAITASPTSISSAEAFGTPVVSLTSNPSPSGIPSAEAFGTVSITGSLLVSPTGLASSEAFGTPSIGGASTVSPSAIPSAEAFGTVSISGAFTASPTGILSGEALGSPTATHTITNLNTNPSFEALIGGGAYPVGIAINSDPPTARGNASALGDGTNAVRFTRTGTAATRAVITQTYTESTAYTVVFKARANILHKHTLQLRPTANSSTGMVELGQPDIGTTTEEFRYFFTSPATAPSGSGLVFITNSGDPWVVSDTIDIDDLMMVQGTYYGPYRDGDYAGWSWSGAADGSTSTGPIPYSAVPTGVASAEAFGTPTVTVGSNPSPTGIPSAEAFGTPAVTTTLTASPTGIASAQVIGTVVVTKTLTVTLTGVVSSEAFGTPVISNAVIVLPTGIVSGTAFGVVTITGGTPGSILYFEGSPITALWFEGSQITALWFEGQQVL